MEKEIHNEKKLVVYWLSKEESVDQDKLDKIKTESKLYKEKKFKVAVFHSGKEPLYDHALNLLKHNMNKGFNPVKKIVTG